VEELVAFNHRVESSILSAPTEASLCALSFRLDLTQHPDAVAVEAYARPTAMAVCADDLALRDLGENAFEWDRAIRELTDVALLVAEVVELENNRIGLATVDARMIKEITQHCPPIRRPHSVGSLLDPGARPRWISCMGELRLGDVAFAAGVLASIAVSTVAMKLS
jgi:hypothetical protein